MLLFRERKLRQKTVVSGNGRVCYIFFFFSYPAVLDGFEENPHTIHDEDFTHPQLICEERLCNTESQF